MPTSPDDQRPPLAIAMQWVSQITSVSMMMALPIVAGLYCDRWLGTKPWLVIVGALAGSALGFIQLMEMVSRMNSASSRNAKQKRPDQ